MNKFSLGVSNPWRVKMNEDFFVKLAEAKIELLEVSFVSEDYCKLDWKELAGWSRKSGVKIWSFHFPFVPFSEIDISSTDRELRNKTLVYLEKLMKEAAEFGVEKMVIHPSGEPIDDIDRIEKMKCAKDSLNELAEKADKLGQIICVENLPRTCLGKNSSEILDLISANEKLRVCYDTNHLLSQNYENFIDDLGDRIVTTHFSDYDFIDERHWLPGDGKNDWSGIINKLNGVGYSGPILYETFFKQENNPKHDCLTLKDYADNHKWLVSLIK